MATKSAGGTTSTRSANRAADLSISAPARGTPVATLRAAAVATADTWAIATEIVATTDT